MQEVNQLIGLYKQQTASLAQRTDMMARLTRILENVSIELSKENGTLTPLPHAHVKNPLPFFMGCPSGITQDVTER